MRLKKYILVFLLFSVFITNSWAGIVQRILDENFSAVIRPFSSKWYVGTLYIEGNKLKIKYESDFSRYPTIMAYKISEEKIDIIIKSIPFKNIPKNNEIFSPTYYLITLFIENSNINYVCYFIENPYLIIDGFTFNFGKINEEHVNVRTKPTTKSTIYSKLNLGANVTVTSIGNDLIKIAQMLDFWLEIEIDNKKFWIYGYYIEFLKEIIL